MPRCGFLVRFHVSSALPAVPAIGSIAGVRRSEMLTHRGDFGREKAQEAQNKAVSFMCLLEAELLGLRLRRAVD